ncbi:MlaD family protein [Tropicibacter oceani]|uniref:MlaD family protein n=1 Tax=Tropicibacter oceani TaxID=3058420 RepID=A0ABY8QGV2_9RHOB|nr:MlaD family protein [Tropicibacter oceani]WGW03760.1 MlaD family protein [Tropicibacter oceani]
MNDDSTPRVGTPGEVPLKPAVDKPSGVSLIWVIPAIAILAAIGVAWQNYTSRGPLIQVTFARADGVRPLETELRYRDIPVGLVEDVHFSDDLGQVVAEIRLDKDIAPNVDADAEFWIVRPKVTAQGVSGLDTVLSGVYINGSWDGEPGPAKTAFQGAENAPLLALGEAGVTFTLRSDTGLPAEGTPILYRGVQVGRIGRTELTPEGLAVQAQAVILEPHTSLVSSSSRFWDISGFSLSLDSSGASLNFTSLASLISGGMTFETLASGGQPLSADSEFTLHPNEDTAREEFLLEGDGSTVSLMMVFEENIAGLQAGAPVTLGGLRLGEVETISGIVDQARFGDNEARLLATVRLNPGRLGLETGGDDSIFLEYLDERIAEGLRARLTNASILTGGLKVELILDDTAPQATLDRDASPYPRIPTAPSSVTNVAASAQGLIQRIDALPVEELMDEIINTLADIRGVVGSEEIQAAPEALLATLESVRKLAESEEVAALPAQVGALADGLNAASDKLNVLLGQVQDEAVVAAVSELIASLDSAAQTLPGLAESAGAVLGKAEALPLDDLSAQLSALVGNADALLTNPDLTALPGDLRAAMDGLRSVVESGEFTALPGQVGDLATSLQQASDKLNALLEEAQQERIVAAMSEVITSFGTTADRLPGLADQASAVLSDAENLSLDELAAQARDLLASIDTVVNQDSTRQLPSELNGALAELRLALEELRNGGVVANANAALASAREAAEAVAEASRSLPALSDRLRAVATQAGTTISDFGRGSDFGRELSGAIRQIDAAAQSIDRLARQIQRNPNSLITGR